MPTRPDISLVNVLNGQAGLVTGTNLFNGPVQPPGNGIPVKAVFVIVAGGNPPEGFLNSSTLRRRKTRVQVRVRGEKAKYDAGLIFARSVWDAVHYAVATDFIDVRVEQADVLYLGEDDAYNPEWSINALMWAVN